MMLLTTIMAALAMIGCALVGGVFFAFSSFVMKALARVSPPGGLEAMQAINIVVLNRSFLGLFMGTAVVSLLVAVLAASQWQAPSSPWLLAGAACYLGGTFMVTGLGNVPLNDQLAVLSPGDPAAAADWSHYLHRWTGLNTLRTIGAVFAALCFTIGLILLAR